MRTTELADLLDAVRELRDEKHPELDWAFLEEVVRIEEAEADNPAKALKLVEQALESAIARMDA